MFDKCDQEVYQERITCLERKLDRTDFWWKVAFIGFVGSGVIGALAARLA